MSTRARVAALAALLALAPQAGGADAADRGARDGDPGRGRDAEITALARFSTSYEHDAQHRARAFNVQLAAEAIDGRVIAPGAVFSFNAVVGERTAAFGFEKAIVLRDGMIAEGTGGGTCQVASTLHAAALLAGLDVVARTPHSRPSAYIRMGLDATVVYPAIDLKLKNTRPTAVLIHARAARGALDVRIEGEGDPPKVMLTSEIVERVPFERILQHPAPGERPVPENMVRVKAFGIPGFRVRRTRVVRDAGGTERRDVRIDEYPPTTEVLVAAPSFDPAHLDASTVRDEAGVARPAPVQLRPSTRVQIDNGAR